MKSWNIKTGLIEKVSCPVSGAVHTGVEVCRMDLEMSGLVE